MRPPMAVKAQETSGQDFWKSRPTCVNIPVKTSRGGGGTAALKGLPGLGCIPPQVPRNQACTEDFAFSPAEQLASAGKRCPFRNTPVRQGEKQPLLDYSAVDESTALVEGPLGDGGIPVVATCTIPYWCPSLSPLSHLPHWLQRCGFLWCYVLSLGETYKLFSMKTQP
ncbi:Hypothetical predicted protein [Podarcis lilfordi]|uniref:Uncharacterized protein n=1 Tax=Podarcis lilfordi TaxID=74358 RepID=A0AA35P165_9SAUR|nr:Hypothetical predicted protein [Podarcis lilfordi]